MGYKVTIPMYKLSVIIFLAVAVSVLLAADMPQNFNNSRREEMQKAEPTNITADTNNIRIMVVYDNNPYKKGLETSWGFSCVVTGTKKPFFSIPAAMGNCCLRIRQR